MTATIRFGIPGPDDPEQVVVHAKRPLDANAIDPTMYRKVFPFGIFLDAAGVGTVRALPGHTNPVNANQAGGVRTVLYHPDSGLIPNGFNFIAWTNQQPYNQEGIQGLSDVIETANGRVLQVAAPFAKTDSGGTLGWDTAAWFGTAYNASFHTDAQAETVATAVLDYYDDHPSVVAFSIRDDVSAVGGEMEYREAAIAVKAMQALDPRPTSCIWTDSTALAEAQAITDVRFQMGYVYPVGHYSNGDPTAEGDFHRMTYSGLDYLDVIALSETAPETCWLIVQAHKTESGGATRLRYPTANEFKKLTWVSIGEGYKGLFWFCWTDQDPNWEGIGNPNSRTRLEAIAAMGNRINANIRARILQTNKVADKFTATGGGTTGLPIDYDDAYISTLYDQTHDIYYCVVCNNSTSTTDVTIDSVDLEGYLRNLETGAEVAIGGDVSLGPLDGAMLMHVPNSLYQVMRRASDNVVEGCRWQRDNGLALTGIAGNGCFDYSITLDAIWTPSDTAPVDDHDGNYGEAHKLHGLCLKYLRTGDHTLIPDIEAQVQWHIDIEQALVADAGSYWEGAAPYWYWTSTTPTAAMTTEGYGDPSINGGLGTSKTYSQGDVRWWTSIDQAHMVAHGLYSYLYLLRNDPAVRANTTLWNDALDLLDRMATFEEDQTSYAKPDHSKMLGNLNLVCNGQTPTRSNGLTSTTMFWGAIFGPWQVTNTTPTGIAPSSNTTIDSFFLSVVAPNTTVAGIKTMLRGRAMDMLASDLGYHDGDWDSAFDASKPVGTYPKGWMIRAQAGSTIRYATPRTIASNNGFSSDLHYYYIANSSARDGISGRAPQRLIVLCLLALIDPTYDIPVELDADGSTVLRSVNVVEACNNAAATMAQYLPENTETKCIRFTTPMHLGVTGSHPTDVVDSAFTGYWMMAVELWHLVNSGADYTDYYPIGLW